MKMKLLNVMAAVVASLALVAASTPVRATDQDDQIEKSAKSLYVFKTYLKGDDVKIKSKDGVVTLTGTVSDEPRKRLAEETVASLRGVKSVNNELEIKGERPAENSDAWIAARVKTVLFFHRSVSGLNTDVAVKDGNVTLRGEATSQAQRELSTEYARDVDGVKDVKNEMTVAKALKEKASIGEKIDDASITSQVKMSLLFHRSTSALKTQVETEDGVVTLSGMAKSGAEKDLVTKLVNDVNGVVKVNNRMTIQ
jgi:osmotically-inducible protein OsmY